MTRFFFRDAAVKRKQKKKERQGRGRGRRHLFFFCVIITGPLTGFFFYLVLAIFHLDGTASMGSKGFDRLAIGFHWVAMGSSGWKVGLNGLKWVWLSKNGFERVLLG